MGATEKRSITTWGGKNDLNKADQGAIWAVVYTQEDHPFRRRKGQQEEKRALWRQAGPVCGEGILYQLGGGGGGIKTHRADLEKKDGVKGSIKS